jgi:hypothetical protein
MSSHNNGLRFTNELKILREGSVKEKGVYERSISTQYFVQFIMDLKIWEKGET